MEATSPAPTDTRRCIVSYGDLRGLLSLLFSDLMHECYVIINSLMFLSEFLVAILHYIIKSFPELISWYQSESGISITELLY